MQRNTGQFDLFAPPNDVGKTRTPEWRTLPATTRQTLTDLMVRLFLDHAAGQARFDGRRPERGATSHDH